MLSCLSQPGTVTARVHVKRLLSSPLCSISLSLLDLLKSLHGSVQSMSVVSSKLGICTLEGWISVRLWLLDTVFTHRQSHSVLPIRPVKCRKGRTRFGEPSWLGCAGTSSLTLDTQSDHTSSGSRHVHLLAISTVFVT